jgi:hypothetical protein
MYETITDVEKYYILAQQISYTSPGKYSPWIPKEETHVVNRKVISGQQSNNTSIKLAFIYSSSQITNLKLRFKWFIQVSTASIYEYK